MTNHRERGRISIIALAVSVGTAGASSAAKPPDCRSFSFPVYFSATAATLTPAADRVIRSTSPRMASCSVEAVTISVGADRSQADLNQRRAKAVSLAIIEAGAPSELTRVEERGAPLKLFRRRVIVSISLLPR